jgi:hypothetical protein
VNIMAIHTVEGSYVAATKSYTYGEPVVTFEGRVCIVKTECERIMSDVWEDVTRALVYTPETRGTMPKWAWKLQDSDYVWLAVKTHGEMYSAKTHAEVDAPAEIIARYHEQNNARIAAEKAAYEAEQARERRLQITKGKVVKVVKGRKVAKGTTGLVFWEGNNGYGPTVGIALTPAQGQRQGNNGKTYNGYLNVVFISTLNLEVVGSDSDEGIAAAVTAWENQGK